MHRQNAFTFAKLAIVGVMVAAIMALCACTAPAQQTQQPKAETPSTYMVKVSKAAGVLGERMTEFADAVSNGDIATMQARAQSAFSAMDEMNAIEVPEGLDEMHDKYVKGCASLRKSLEQYMELFTSAEDSGSGGIDAGLYGKKLEEAQKLYDEGLNTLEEADGMAAEL